MKESTVVACPQCAGLNRVPVERLAESPRCGRCKSLLFSGHPLSLTATDFDAHAFRSDLPLLLDFWAPWCGPCRMMAPHYEAAARDLEPLFRVAKVDTESEPELGSRFAIRSIPTLVLFSGGREIARQAGAMTREQILNWASAHH